MEVLKKEKLSGNVYSLEVLMNYDEIELMETESKRHHLVYYGIDTQNMSDAVAVADAICESFNTNLDEVRAICRDRKLTNIRMFIAYILRTKMLYTYGGIGRIINRHHATAMHYMKRMETYMLYGDTKKEYEDALDAVKQLGLF